MQPAPEPSVDRHLHIAGAGDAPAPVHEPVTFEQFPEAVLDALREIRNVREEHLRRLSLADRRKLARAEHVQALYIDLVAQIDGNGKHDAQAT